MQQPAAGADPIADRLRDSGIEVARIYGRDRFDPEAERLRFQTGEAKVCVFTTVASISLHAGETLRLSINGREDDWLVVGIAGEDLDGNPIVKTVALPLGEGGSGRGRAVRGGDARGRTAARGDDGGRHRQHRQRLLLDADRRTRVQRRLGDQRLEIDVWLVEAVEQNDAGHAQIAQLPKL